MTTRLQRLIEAVRSPHREKWIRFVLGLWIIAWTMPIQAQVWSHTKADWTESDESRFAEWVSRATQGEPEQLFQAHRELRILSQSPVDCADFAYALRIIFASENGLPFRSKAPGLGQLINSQNTRWNNLPIQQRLKAFLQFSFINLSTRTLPFDTFAIAIAQRHNLRPGTLLLASPEIGHVWVIRGLQDTGIPELVFGSVPDRTEVYFHQGLPRGEAVFGRKAPQTSTSAGFRSWSRTDSETPNSPMKVSEWRSKTLKTLAVRTESLTEAISRQLTNICREVRTRARLVRDAGALRSIRRSDQGRPACLNTQDHYNYSTTNRDSRLHEGFLDLWDLWMTANNWVDETRERKEAVSKRTQDSLDRIDQVFSHRSIDPQLEDIVCPVQIDVDQSLSLRDVRAATVNGRLSVDPNESVLARWGLEPEQGLCRNRN